MNRVLKKNAADYLVQLNKSDEQILESYCVLCECLTLSLGAAYEIVVHSLGINDQFILKIANGNHSGRSEADTLDNAVIVVLEQLYAMVKHNDTPVVICFSMGKDGNVYKSTTIGILGSRKKLIGILCLNLYFNTPLFEIVKSVALPNYLFTGSTSSTSHDDQGHDVYLYETIKNARQAVMDNSDIPSKFKKKEIIRNLNEMGIFNIKKGVSICAEILGVTISTIYLHIRNHDVSGDRT